MCSIEGCNRKTIARGFCMRHYDAWRYHGDPLKRTRAENGEPVQWLRDHVGFNGEQCLLWPFGKMNAGRGVVCFEGQMNSASRVMCELAHGEPPTPKHESAHSCGKGHLACVNPSHLRWATDQENHDDMYGHGTVLKGAKNPSAKLTAEQVEIIITRLAKGDLGKDIAEEFGVHKATISDIKLRKTWSHLT